MAAVGTKLSTILTAIKTKLVTTDALFPSERCRVALRMNVPNHNQADQYCVILPLHQPHDQAAVAGHGRRGTIVEGRINVYLRQRLGTDDWYADDQWLLASTPGDSSNPPGFLETLGLIEDSLDLFNPLDGSNRPILAEPMRAWFANEPRKDYDSPDWGEGMVEIEVKYLAYRTGF